MAFPKANKIPDKRRGSIPGCKGKGFFRDMGGGRGGKKEGVRGRGKYPNRSVRSKKFIFLEN